MFWVWLFTYMAIYSNDPSVDILKYADDTVIVGLIKQNEDA